ncbi:MAG: hypothetical protein OXN97_10510 [Bryobacterales bacterium]|nr:hypothetical protein [Bryobacterales bacterium]
MGGAGLGPQAAAAFERGDQRDSAGSRGCSRAWEHAVDVIGYLEPAGEGEQGGGGTELAHVGLDGPGGELGGPDRGEDRAGTAEGGG